MLLFVSWLGKIVDLNIKHLEYCRRCIIGIDVYHRPVYPYDFIVISTIFYMKLRSTIFLQFTTIFGEIGEKKYFSSNFEHSFCSEPIWCLSVTNEKKEDPEWLLLQTLWIVLITAIHFKRSLDRRLVGWSFHCDCHSCLHVTVRDKEWMHMCQLTLANS